MNAGLSMKDARRGRPAREARERAEALLLEGLPNAVVAEVVGFTRSRVSQIRKELGLPMGSRATGSDLQRARRRSGLDPLAGVPTPRPRLCSAPAGFVSTTAIVSDGPSGAPGWSPERDGAVLATKGRYAQIAKLAERWRIESRLITARWHVLRQGNGPGHSDRPGSVSPRDAREGAAR